ncbi:hypothetical protein ACWO4B_000965 [Clostridium sporogenes]
MEVIGKKIGSKNQVKVLLKYKIMKKEYTTLKIESLKYAKKEDYM